MIYGTTQENAVGKIYDERRRYYVYPQRILWTSSEFMSSPESLLKDSFESTQIRTGERSEGFLLDFGFELHGGLQFRIDSIRHKGVQIPQCRLRIRFGESASEAMGTPNNDHATHDMTVDVPVMSLNEIGQSGFRFVRIDILDSNVVIDLCSIKAVALEYDWEHLGTFTCSDQLLNNVYKVCARTALLCAQEYVWDGIKRDRLVWAGDVHPQLSSLATVFGMQADGVIERTLAFLADTTHEDGWINSISSYSLWWLISVYEWYQYTGDIDFVKRQDSRVEKITSKILRHITSDGIEELDGMRFLDWSSAGEKYKDKIGAGLGLLSIWGIECAAKLAEISSNEILQNRCLSIAKKMREHCILPCGLKQNAALGVLAGVYDVAKMDHEYFTENQLDNISPWFGGYYLDVKAMAGDISGALEIIRRYWGGMLELGATSFWEHFDVKWLDNACRIDELSDGSTVDVHSTYGDFCYCGLRHSLCHGWASRPAAWLVANVLGIKSLNPGMTRVRVSPGLGNLDYAYGTFPTPSGIIKVSHERKSDGHILSNIEVPEGVELFTDGTGQ